MTISYSAPGAFSLSGRYSLHHFKPALFVACSLQLSFTLKQSTTADTKNTYFQIISSVDQTVQEFLQQKNIPFKVQPFHFWVDSSIPTGSVFGFSTALLITATSAIFNFYSNVSVENFGKKPFLELLEKVILNQQSILNQIVEVKPSLYSQFFGGLSYARSDFDFLILQDNLPFSIQPEMEENMFLIYSGKPEENEENLKLFVEEKTQKDPANTKKTFHDIERVTKNMVQAIYQNQPDLLKISLRRSQNLQTKLGLISEVSKKIIHQLQDFGEVSLVDFGGIKNHSGYFFMFCETSKVTKLKTFLQQKGMVYFPIKQNLEGSSLVQN